MEPIIIAIAVAGAVTIIWLLFMGTMIVLSYRAYKQHSKGVRTWMSRLLTRIPIAFKNMERLNVRHISFLRAGAVKDVVAMDVLTFFLC
jgi:hypothetical protein